MNVCLDANNKFSITGGKFDVIEEKLKKVGKYNMATFIHFMAPFGLMAPVLLCGLLISFWGMMSKYSLLGSFRKDARDQIELFFKYN